MVTDSNFTLKMDRVLKAFARAEKLNKDQNISIAPDSQRNKQKTFGSAQQIFDATQVEN